ncbi:MAG TPA: DUF72 domain-containing protein [Terriglobales bacterium]|nr:DUF72 domain-containing protein [Terriglobales bacterium]
MAELFAGTSGWAYPTWKPGFYPEKLAQSKFLAHYASRLNTVEVNYTFRHRLTEKTTQNWLAQTPPDFRFAFKAHQAITHFRQLRECAQLVSDFLAALNPFAAARKVGPVLFQTPPHLKCDVELLGEFVAVLPRSGHFAFEFRHESWFAAPVYDLLREHNLALCMAESEKLEVPRIRTADFVYLRLRREPYDAASLAEISKQAREHVNSGADVFAYFKHEDDPMGALHAELLLEGSSATLA